MLHLQTTLVEYDVDLVDDVNDEEEEEEECWRCSFRVGGDSFFHGDGNKDDDDEKCIKYDVYYGAVLCNRCLFEANTCYRRCFDCTRKVLLPQFRDMWFHKSVTRLSFGESFCHYEASEDRAWCLRCLYKTPNEIKLCQYQYNK